MNGRSVQGAEQEQDIFRGLRAADTFAALLEQAGIDHARVPRRVSEPDGGADFILPSGVGIDVKTTTLPDRVVVCCEQIDCLPEWLACFHTTGNSERFLGVIRSEEFLSHSALVGREGEMPGPAGANGDPYRAHDDLRVLWGPGLDRLLPITALREDT